MKFADFYRWIDACFCMIRLHDTQRNFSIKIQQKIHESLINSSYLQSIHANVATEK